MVGTEEPKMRMLVQCNKFIVQINEKAENMC
jgi:hypothetical protein